MPGHDFHVKQVEANCEEGALFNAFVAPAKFGNVSDDFLQGPVSLKTAVESVGGDLACMPLKRIKPIAPAGVLVEGALPSVLLHDAQDALVIDVPAQPLQFSGYPSVAHVGVVLVVKGDFVD